MYGPQLAGVWDLFYRQGRGKNYAAEADEVARIILDRRPSASSVLDVACGTGEHLTTLGSHFPTAEGVDISEAMLSKARGKLPAESLHLGDMRDFRLDRDFDAVVCLNTGVAYLGSLSELGMAVKQMTGHLREGGVLVVEPWWFRDKYLDGYIAADTVRSAGRCISRMSHTRAHNGAARMDIHYVVADDDGIEHFTETHVFGLWSREEYAKAFEDAGCDVEYREESLSGYGMFVACPR